MGRRLEGRMERKTAADFDQELLILFDAYVHGAIDRRGFLNKASKYAVGGVTAAMLLDQLSPNFAAAQQVTPDDKRLKTEGSSIRRRREIPRRTGMSSDPQTRQESSLASSSSTRTEG